MDNDAFEKILQLEDELKQELFESIRDVRNRALRGDYYSNKELEERATLLAGIIGRKIRNFILQHIKPCQEK